MSAFRFIPLQVKLSANGDVSNKVQLLRTGVFYDERYGKLDITSEILLAMKKNFDANVRGIALAIDYKHDADNIAAGWIKDVELSNNDTELWATIDWTPNGRKVLSDKEFRYLSADFNFNYQDNETLQKFGPTLFGAGLTNRPVVKNMEPAVALQEFNPKGNKMTNEEMQKKMTDLEAMIVKLSSPIPPAAPAPAAPAAPMAPAKKLGADGQPLDGDAASDEDLMKKIQDLEAQLGAVNTKCAGYEKQMGDMQAAQKLAEKEVAFQKLLTEGRAVPAQKESYLSGDMMKFAETSQAVNLRSMGHGGNPPAPTGSVDEQILKLAEKKMTENKNLSHKEAISAVLSENTVLANQRRA